MLSRSLISEYPGYSLISEPITAREKHYSLAGYMLTVDIYFLLSNQSARKVLFTCLVYTKSRYQDKLYKICSKNPTLGFFAKIYLFTFSLFSLVILFHAADQASQPMTLCFWNIQRVIVCFQLFDKTFLLDNKKLQINCCT